MTRPEYEPGSEAATPAALGNLFKIAAPWIQEHGSVDVMDALETSEIYGETVSDDMAPHFEFDSGILHALFPEAASALNVAPGQSITCSFYPAHMYESDDEEQILVPPECVFDIVHDDDLIEAVTFTIILADMDTIEWLGRGSKRTYYRNVLAPSDTTEAERTINMKEAIFLHNSIPIDPITPEECRALQTIADNFDRLKEAQENPNRL